ncbi:MAG TPA: SdrD B-like domain-containing protein [Anaerolineales bacterium]|nr:SdrD B-like domain-containing protein [Anaerolineales bacterium]
MRPVTSVLIALLLTACSAPATVQPTATTEAILPSSTSTLTATAVPSATSTPQPRLTPVAYGPEAEDFPSSINPLTGREVSDPSLLKFPAVLVSISNMPVTARPQAGPGFAPWVYELYIGEGTTRFLNVFYGDIPRAIPNVVGGCEVRDEITRPSRDWIGNRVWLDENENGLQDAWEAGVGGVCVRLLDGASREVITETTTDSNGYYALDRVDAATILQFVKPDSYRFTQSNIGDDDRDSDADLNGETIVFQADSTAAFWDAGLVLTEAPVPEPTPVVTGTPPGWYIPSEPYVGPIRSGRLTYNQIGHTFPNSCLVYSGAAWDIGEMLDACEVIPGVDRTTPNSSLLTVARLRVLTEQNLNPRQPVNYSGNLFSDTVPDGGLPASAIHVFYHSYTQSAWQYDPVSQTYLRWTDLADGTGTLIPATDRLTERQMAFENVIVVFAEHNRYRHNQLDIDFRHGQKNHAYLFRDGQAFKIRWSTENREWEKTTGLLRPMHFMDAQGDLVPLRPGRTWIHIITPFSAVTDQGNGNWLVQFVQPYDPVDTPVPE